MPSKSMQTDKPPGICSNTDLSRLDSILPIRSCSGGSSNMRVVSEISCGSYGTIAIMLTAELSVSSQQHQIMGECACDTPIFYSYLPLSSLLHSCVS